MCNAEHFILTSTSLLINADQQSKVPDFWRAGFDTMSFKTGCNINPQYLNHTRHLTFIPSFQDLYVSCFLLISL